MSEVCKSFGCVKRDACIMKNELCEIAQTCNFLKSLGRCDLCAESRWCPLPQRERRKENGKPRQPHYKRR